MAAAASPVSALSAAVQAHVKLLASVAQAAAEHAADRPQLQLPKP